MHSKHFVVGRRTFLSGSAAVSSLALAGQAKAKAEPVNLALVAKAAASTNPAKSELQVLNSGFTPANSKDVTHDAFRVWDKAGWHWVEYEWPMAVTTDRVDIYWHADGTWFGVPQAARVLTWNGSAFEPVANVKGAVLEKDRYNTLTFKPVTTNKIRLEFISDGKWPVAILQWRVMSSGPVPALPPIVEAGPDRIVIAGGRTYLNGKARWVEDKPTNVTIWNKASGPGDIVFADAAARSTSAKVTAPGMYDMEFVARGDTGTVDSRLRLRVAPPPPEKRLDVVYTTPYALTSPLWKARVKALIVNWIPHCIAQCERTDLTKGEGGLDNFIEAAKALRGEPHGKHKGYVFSNAWVHQTVESMSIALMVDADGDPEILSAQQHMRGTLEKWIPIILAAQEPDGYLQTAYTLADRKEWPERWSPDHRGNHEGYVSGYFIESAINHYTLTGGKDLRLYNAAKKLADCWVANIGPGKKAWFDGHQEMEQALVRFGRFVNDTEGHGKGDAYIALAKFLLESRKGGTEYDQSHLPAVQQYEAVGHAVRAMYFYSGMADVAAETGDRDYQSAVVSLWDNMTNRKYYVTGGIGSVYTWEGFGENYELPVRAYAESCSSCGLVFFQYKLNLAYHDAKYADLYEETMYNALLGSVDLAGKNYTYTNPLEDPTPRYKWHDCPCCVGNIPRTLLMVPTWSYVKDAQGIYVNLFIGSKVNVGEIAGTKVQMVQDTNYPWSGAVAITVNPAEPRDFTVHVRVPNRSTSTLYAASPRVEGLKRLAVNGKPVDVKVVNGYAVITRRWKKGDKIELELPLAVETITADNRIEAARGRVALRYGPLLYSVETADQPHIDLALAKEPLTATWRGDLLGGVMAISGKWQDGSPMLAIPNYARMNRGVTPTEYPPDYQPTAPILSQVWMKA